ncbi:MAG TPA: ATP-binding cassette domain-containing protein [Chitinophagales bacterium]|nr:ATP-binding cassette domain-containing protein [Chitinophagales bacterium]
MIEVRHLSKSFGEQRVLDDISATFDTGHTNLVIGRSGSGKTVFIKCMVGLLEADHGEILYDGRDFIKMNREEKKAIRKEFGMLFQGTALFDSLTVEENVRFPLDMFSNMNLKEKKKRVDEVLHHVNLDGAQKKYPDEISGGMKKRVGIARAIVLGPKYLFCDEPNSGLDPKTAIIIDDLIKRLTVELNITTIVNTHDMNSVMGIGDKVVFLHQGKKHWEGSNKEILHTDNEELNNFIFASKFLKELKKGTV